MRNQSKKSETHLRSLVFAELIKGSLCFFARALRLLGFLDQHIALTSSDVHLSFLLVDLDFPRLQLLLLRFDLVVIDLGLVCAEVNDTVRQRMIWAAPFRLSRICSSTFSSWAREASNSSSFRLSLAIFSSLSTIARSASAFARSSCAQPRQRLPAMK